MTEIDLLTQADCSKIRSAVHELKRFWVQRHSTYPFYTLGTASYIDAVGGQENYCARAASSNLLLNEQFRWLYDRLEKALEDHLGAKVRTHDRYALPGFHIFLAHEVFQKSVASIHCDLQQELLDWGEFVDRSRPLSFTLSISLPQAGAGLHLWDITRGDIAGLSPPQAEEFIRSRKSHYIAYKEGGMLLHSGDQIHQIAPMTGAQPGEERITLQGHAILCNDVWQLYW